ncbi:MAG: OmpA family protein [Acidimicrobiales bacterium]
MTATDPDPSVLVSPPAGEETEERPNRYRPVVIGLFVFLLFIVAGLLLARCGDDDGSRVSTSRAASSLVAQQLRARLAAEGIENIDVHVRPSGKVVYRGRASSEAVLARVSALALEVNNGRAPLVNELRLASDPADPAGDVRAALADAGYEDVGVAVDARGVITLSGLVEDDAAKAEAARLAAAAAPGATIDNRLLTRTVLDRVRAALDREGFRAVDVSAGVDGSIVLGGRAASEADKARAAGVATAAAPAGAKVDNRLVVGPASTGGTSSTSAPADPAAAVRAALVRAGYPEARVAAAADGSVVLTGVAGTAAIRDRIVAIAKGAATATITDRMALAVASPAVSTVPAGEVGKVTAAYEAGGAKLRLTGLVPDQATADAIVAAANSAVGPGNVVNELRVAAQPAQQGTIIVISGRLTDAAVAGQLRRFGADAAAATGYRFDDSQLTLEVSTDARAVEGSLDQLFSQGDVLFASGSAELTPEARAVLDQAVEILRAARSGSVTIEGHTDTDGSEGANLALSQNRAEAVRQYLVDSGIDAGRLNALGKGEAEPKAPNDSPANKALNRRIEFVLG